MGYAFFVARHPLSGQLRAGVFVFCGQNMDVRHATAEDIPRLMEMGREMFAESRYAERYTFNPGSVLQAFVTFIYTSTCIFLVTDHGFFMGEVKPFWFASGLIATEHILFVSKDYRRSREGLALMKQYEKEAKRMGATEVCISNSSGIQSERVERLYELLGFSRLGGNYVKEVSE